MRFLRQTRSPGGRRAVAALAVAAVLMLAANWEHSSSYDRASGDVMLVDCDALGTGLLCPQVRSARQNPSRVLISHDAPPNTDAAAVAIVVDLDDRTTTAVAGVDSLEFDLDAAGLISSRDVQMGQRAIPRPHGHGVARLTFRGLHLQLPAYAVFGFPDPSNTGWHLVHRYTGTISISLHDEQGKRYAEIRRRLINARHLPSLVDVGVWDDHGRFFLVESDCNSRARLVFMQSNADWGNNNEAD